MVFEAVGFFKDARIVLIVEINAMRMVFGRIRVGMFVERASTERVESEV
ncbi:MAG: hypothetical protein MZU79_02725 [Anaerotruncus sp.]|nr:hypothetical protein [Anaerotruncus sp.]